MLRRAEISERLSFINNIEWTYIASAAPYVLSPHFGGRSRFILPWEAAHAPIWLPQQYFRCFLCRIQSTSDVIGMFPNVAVLLMQINTSKRFHEPTATNNRKTFTKAANKRTVNAADDNFLME